MSIVCFCGLIPMAPHPQVLSVRGVAAALVLEDGGIASGRQSRGEIDISGTQFLIGRSAEERRIPATFSGMVGVGAENRAVPHNRLDV